MYGWGLIDDSEAGSTVQDILKEVVRTEWSPTSIVNLAFLFSALDDPASASVKSELPGDEIGDSWTVTAAHYPRSVLSASDPGRRVRTPSLRSRFR